MAFKLAGRLAFRAAMEQAKPALLEPIMKVEIEAPDEFVPPAISEKIAAGAKRPTGEEPQGLLLEQL